jgi:hypothetical protein
MGSEGIQVTTTVDLVGELHELKVATVLLAQEVRALADRFQELSERLDRKHEDASDSVRELAESLAEVRERMASYEASGGVGRAATAAVGGAASATALTVSYVIARLFGVTPP